MYEDEDNTEMILRKHDQGRVMFIRSWTRTKIFCYEKFREFL